MTDLRPAPAVYVIHLDAPYYHARHYTGCAADVRRRLSEHRNGAGSPLLAAATASGITWDVVRVVYCDSYHHARTAEATIKAHQRNADYCPLCCHSRNPRTIRPR